MSSNRVQEPKPMKLYTRIVLFFVLAFSILLVISFVMVFYFSQQIVLNENRSNLIKFNSYIINVIKENEEALLSLPTSSRLDFISEKIYPNIKDNTLISYKISDNYGDVYLSSEGVDELLNQDNFSEYNIDIFKVHIDNPADQTEDNVDVDSFRYNKNEYYYLGSSYLVSDDYTIYIQVVKNLNDSFVYMTALFSIQIAISIVCLAIIIFIGIYGTKRSLKPLIEIAETAKNITENNLNTRIKETGNDDELDQLIKSLNQMIGQLESAFDAQKQFVSDASHELRIPLTVIQGYSDILSSWGKENPQLLEESVDSINEEIQNMKKLVEELVKTNTNVSIFLEHDFTRFLDYIRELPAGCQLMAEFGDPKVFKEKLGDKFILTGFYPLAMLKTGTLNEIQDKAKEIIDILAPGGRYIFSLDKSILRVSDVEIDKYQALLRFVKEYAVY